MPKLERTALISDVHGNSPALRTVLNDVACEQCARVYVLGDIINGIDPHGCLELLRSIENVTCILGNAESYTLTPDLDLFPQRHEPFYADLITLVKWFRAQLSEADWQWLNEIPEMWQWDGTYLVHDSPFDRVRVEEKYPPGIDGKYRELFFHGKGISPQTSNDELAKLFEWMRSENLSKLFCAHTHVPLYKQDGENFICNVGSVGLPLDSDPRSAWVLLDEASGKTEITLHRVSYDLDELFALIDHTPDYPKFDQPNFKYAYKKMFETATHWSAYKK